MFHDGNTNAGRLYLSNRVKLQNNLVVLGIFVDTFEQFASIHKNWREKYRKATKKFAKNKTKQNKTKYLKHRSV